jgi:hypothetical protein
MATDKIKFDKYILIRYFQEYLPVEQESENVIYKTSQQIQDELSEMADISINQIAATMVELQYKLTIGPDGRPAWMMLRK